MGNATVTVLQTLSITSSLMVAGGIATLSLFDVPMLQAQPASRSLPSVRWLFSRGSHLMPTAAFAAGTGFVVLGVLALPPAAAVGGGLVARILAGTGTQGYLAAAACNFAIGPVTGLMLPTNFALIQKNEAHGGVRSERAATANKYRPGQRSADDSVAGKGEGNQFTDLSGPQEKTPLGSSQAEDEEVRRLLGKFARMNAVRAAFCMVGGVVGLCTALA
ncbi:hypothetical protein PG999_012329 [Apiospora kogelbergensis]|uniref:DUF1772-domain-containing protein n=1 Tax=Apiospora kogelbergensis TaxID=1337665 RepID=A0AAW0QFN3_9PEZI